MCPRLNRTSWLPLTSQPPKCLGQQVHATMSTMLSMVTAIISNLDRIPSAVSEKQRPRRRALKFRTPVSTVQGSKDGWPVVLSQGVYSGAM